MTSVPPNDPAGYGSGGVRDVGDLPRIQQPAASAPAYPATPELDKQSGIINSGQARIVQEFYDWLIEQGYVLARYVPDEERFEGDGIYGEQPVAVFVQPEQLMADHFGIDRDKIETERRALLAALQDQS